MSNKIASINESKMGLLFDVLRWCSSRVWLLDSSITSTNIEMVGSSTVTPPHQKLGTHTSIYEPLFSDVSHFSIWNELMLQREWKKNPISPNGRIIEGVESPYYYRKSTKWKNRNATRYRFLLKIRLENALIYHLPKKGFFAQFSKIDLRSDLSFFLSLLTAATDLFVEPIG